MSPLGKGSCEKIEDRLFPARSVRRSARSTRWNVRSARVFGCGFKTAGHAAGTAEILQTQIYPRSRGAFGGTTLVIRR